MRPEKKQSVIGQLFGADNRPKHYRCTSTGYPSCRPTNSIKALKATNIVTVYCSTIKPKTVYIMQTTRSEEAERTSHISDNQPDLWTRAASSPSFH